MNREELAWAAGFVEGEGCFSLRKDSRRLSLSVTQYKHGFDRLNRLKVALLGVGSIQGPYPPRRALTYRVASFQETQATLCLMWPFFTEAYKGQLLTLLKSKKKLPIGYKGVGRPSRFSNETRTEIITLYSQGGITQYELASRYETTQPNIARILRRGVRH